MEEGRRLAGWPGLGGASAKWILAKAVGRPPTRQADPPLTTEGGGWGWTAMRRTSWGMPDTPPQSPMLLLHSITIAAIGRREENITRSPLLPLSIDIAQEEVTGGWAGVVVVNGWMADAVMVNADRVVDAAASSSHPRPSSQPLVGRGAATTKPLRPLPAPRRGPTPQEVQALGRGAGEMKLAAVTMVAAKRWVVTALMVAPMSCCWTVPMLVMGIAPLMTLTL